CGLAKNGGHGAMQSPRDLKARCHAPLPTLIWGMLSQAPLAGCENGGLAQRRRAEPYGAQRGAAVDMDQDWLPGIAAVHCITSYPVGPPWSVPTFRMLAARKPNGWDPSTRAAVSWPKGGTVTIHPALTAVAPWR